MKMAKKPMSPEKLEKLKLKREKEIRKWEKEKARPKRNMYFVYLVFIITLIYAVDEIASQIGTQMQTDIAADLLANFGERSNTVLSVLGVVPVLFSAVGLLYRPLADRFGRKTFLIINTFGMSFAMLIVFLSNNLLLYLVGACAVSFFIPHDMHVVYIMESSPSKHRARFYSTIKFVANMGVMLIPLMRRLLMKDISQWRNVYFVPAIVGLVVCFIALFLAREPDAFIDSRLRYLRMTDEQRETEEKEKSHQNAQGGLIHALKFAMKHKQLRWLYITTAIVNVGFFGSVNYTPIMKFARAAFIQGGSFSALGSVGQLSTEQLDGISTGFLTTALFFLPIGSSIAQVIMGYVSDWKGRKTAAIVTAFDCLASFVLFFFGAIYGWNEVVVGFFCGAFLGSFYSINDVLIMMIGESSPTNLRSSTMSAQFVVTAVGAVVSFAVGASSGLILGDAYMGVAEIALIVPGFIAALLVLWKKTHETKGVDMEKITGSEWD